MASVIDLYNRALIMLGQETLVGVDDESTRRKTLDMLYPTERDTVLRAHPWNVALRRVTLAQNATAPAFGYAYAYDLPTAPYALRVYELEDPSIIYRVEGRQVLTDAGAPLYATLIVRVDDIALFDALLFDAIATRLAWRAAYRFTESRTLADDLMQQYQAILREARSIDAQEGTPETIASDELLNSRY
jgi:hypothetical protein